MSLFYNIGKKLSPKVRKGKWVWQNLFGSQQEAIAAEYAVGKDLAAQVLSSVSQDSGSEALERVRKIGGQLCRCLVNRDRKFAFYIVQDEKPNAFAIPGGFIFVTDSLLGLCDPDDSQLAFVLGHEMGHVIKGHAMERMVSHSAISTLSHSAPGGRAVKGIIRQMGVKFLQSAYSQDNEHEADTIGAKLVGAANYDRQAPAQLLKKLGELSKKEGGISVYLSTHPPARERVALVKRVITQK